MFNWETCLDTISRSYILLNDFFFIQKGLIFYLSPSVRPSYNDLEEMIKSAGGTVMRDVPNINNFYEKFIDEKKTVSTKHWRICLIIDLKFRLKKGLTSKYIVIGSQNDLPILKPLIEKKIRNLISELKKNFVFREYLNIFYWILKAIYHEELVLSGLLRQKLEANLNIFQMD